MGHTSMTDFMTLIWTILIVKISESFTWLCCEKKVYSADGFYLSQRKTLWWAIGISFSQDSCQ
jgi:hypothetical protein